MEDAANTRFIYQFGEFTLDPQEKTLFENGNSLHLPAKEFETLLFLVQNNGHALSKDQMIQFIWKDSFVEEGNLAKQISRLRKIFNNNGENLIETIPKHGYRFSANIKLIPKTNEVTILEKHTVRKLTVAIEEEIEESPPILPAAKSKAANQIILILGTLVILLTIFGVWYLNKSNSPTKISSLAVLPLKPLTDGESNKALGLGLADALISKIGSLRTVAVRPTSAVIKFVDSDAIETGKKLNVDSVLEGTIQQADGRIRINARLLKVNNGEQIWAEKFDQPESEIFALQDALSNKIAKTLAFEINKIDFAQLSSRPTENAEAYEKYLRGRFYQSQNDEKGLLRSIEFYEQSVSLDAKFAEPYAGIADANVILYNFGLRPASEVIPKAKQSLNQALQLNPNLADAYNAQALIQFFTERDWKSAERSLQKAIEIDPNNANGFLRYGYFLINVGEFDKALIKLEKARDLNPLSPIVQTNIGLAYLCARQYQQAIEQLEKVIAENPEFSLALWFLGLAYEGAGDIDKGFAANLRAMEVEGNKDLAKRLIIIKEKEGLLATYKLWVEDSLKAHKNGYVSSLQIASLNAALKNRDQTLEWLEKSASENEQTISQIKFIARYDFIRDDVRFKKLVEKIEFTK